MIAWMCTYKETFIGGHATDTVQDITITIHEMLLHKLSKEIQSETNKEQMDTLAHRVKEIMTSYLIQSSKPQDVIQHTQDRIADVLTTLASADPPVEEFRALSVSVDTN